MIYPSNMTFLDWADSLIIDFPLDQIPVLYRVEEWKPWGNQVILCDSFMEAAAPSTEEYDDKWEWAEDVYYAMADQG